MKINQMGQLKKIWREGRGSTILRNHVYSTQIKADFGQIHFPEDDDDEDDWLKRDDDCQKNFCSFPIFMF